MSKKEVAGVPVSMKALLARINRKLAGQGEQLKAARSARARLDCGDFYIIDTRENALVGRNVDPVAMGRELGVLRAWEQIVE
jgi:hypothetical protein